MVSMGEIASAVSALKGIKDIVESLTGLGSGTAFQEKRIELNGKIIDAQTAIFAVNDERTQLIGRIGALEAEIARMKNWDTDKQRYEPKTLMGGAAVVYALKPDASGSEKPHWICPTCYENARKSYLQRIADTGRPRDRIWRCPVCKTEAHARWDVTPESPDPKP
jgi:hypothetical protein